MAILRCSTAAFLLLLHTGCLRVGPCAWDDNCEVKQECEGCDISCNNSGSDRVCDDGLTCIEQTDNRGCEGQGEPKWGICVRESAPDKRAARDECASR